MLFRSFTNFKSTMLRTAMSKFNQLGVRKMASVSESMLNQLRATNGKPITCKAAVAWKPKTPLDVTDIQVRYCIRSLKKENRQNCSFKSINFPNYSKCK